MNITDLTKDKESLKKEFEIVISKDEMLAQEEKELQDIATKVKFDGFRKGKVPAAMVKKHYGESVKLRAFEALVSLGLQKLYKEHSVRPIAQPEVKVVSGDFTKEEDVTISVTCEELDTIKDLDLSKLNLIQHKIKVEDEVVDKFLEGLSEQYFTYKEDHDEKELKKGLVANIDFTGSMDGVNFPGGAGSSYDLELGSGSFIAGFEEQLEGLKPNDEKTITVTFPNPYPPKPDYANKEAQFAVKINSIKVKEACPIDQLPKKLGFDSLEALKKDLKNRHAQQYEAIIDKDLKNQVVKQIVKIADFKLPQSYLDEEIKALQDSYSDYKKAQEANPQAQQSNPMFDGKSEEEVQVAIANAAQERVKTSLLFRYIADTYKLNVKTSEVDAFIKKEVANFPPAQAKEMLKKYHANKDIMSRVAAVLLEEKILEKIYSEATRTQKESSVKEYNEWLKNNQ